MDQAYKYYETNFKVFSKTTITETQAWLETPNFPWATKMRT